MKIPILLFLLAATASGQSSAGKILEQAFRGAFAGLAPVAQQDQAEIIRSTTTTLSKHVTFRADDTASAICTASGRQHVEWKRLAVNRITTQAVSQADQLNGISKRYLVAFSCDGHRSWDAKTNAWGQWYPIGHVLFPSAIIVEWKNGACGVAESTQLKWFTPGPGAAIAAQAPAANPSQKPDGLPPGMKRAK